MSVYQSVKIPIFVEGEEIEPRDRNADVVATRDAVFRVFVDLPAGFRRRELSARVRLEDASGRQQEYSARAAPPFSSVDSEPDTTFQIAVPGSAISESTRYSVQVVECTSLKSQGVTPIFPETGTAQLGARHTGSLKVHVVPVRFAGLEPDTSEGGLEPYRDLVEAMYPISRLDFTVGARLELGEELDWGVLLEQLRNRRSEDAPPPDTYYYGLVTPAASFEEYCEGECTAGIGYIAGPGSEGLRVAAGIGFSEYRSASTMAHEVGHNHGRPHAPCGTNQQVDADYPYDDAAIGVWGYDRRGRSLVAPAQPDIMGYCDDPWISDHNYQQILIRMAAINSPRAAAEHRSFVDPGEATGVTRYRGLWIERAGARWSYPYQGSVESFTPEAAGVLDAGGDYLASITVYRTLVGEGERALVLVPEPEPGWAAVWIDGAAPIPFAP